MHDPNIRRTNLLLTVLLLTACEPDRALVPPSKTTVAPVANARSSFSVRPMQPAELERAETRSLARMLKREPSTVAAMMDGPEYTAATFTELNYFTADISSAAVINSGSA